MSVFNHFVERAEDETISQHWLTLTKHNLRRFVMVIEIDTLDKAKRSTISTKPNY